MCDNDFPHVRHISLPEEPPVKSPSDLKLAKWLQLENEKPTDEIVDEIIDEIVEIENVTVKFRISETQVIAQVYPNRLSVGDVKKDIGRKFEVDPAWLSMQQCGRELADECLLLETDSDDFGIHDFNMQLVLGEEILKKIRPSFDGDSQEKLIKLPTLDLNVYYDKQRLPDFITVEIPGEDTEDGEPKSVVVEIQNKAIVKPFLCGYKDTATGIEYLDAFTQTGPYFLKWKLRHHKSRITQTHEHKLKLIDTMHEQSSQCFLDGNNVRYVSAATDFVILPKKYQTYAQKMRLENKLAKIILIQRNWRRFLCVRYMKNAAKEYRRLVANRIAEEQAFEEQKLKRIARVERSKQFPRTKDDFDLLYSEVQKWKMAELKRIASLYDGPARIAEVNILLDKEIQLLMGIDRQRQLVFKAMDDLRAENLLEQLGRPIKWIGYKDCVIHLDLIRTQRARFLNEIYKDLKKPLEKEARLELIGKVKQILVNEQDFPEFAKLFDLFDREKNLLIYTKYCDVEVLRQRQLILFMELIKFSKDHIPPKVAKRLCIVCKAVKPYEQFAFRTRQNCVDTCLKCSSLREVSGENTLYLAILRAVQREERKKRCNASFAFVMQVDDVRHIIERIWHSHSILSKCEDLINLRLPRWIRSEDWSPWNCICLTEAEAQDHYKISDLESVYDHKMMLEIFNRHKLARATFHKLAAVATEFVEVGQWFKVGMNKQRQEEMKPIFTGKEF